MPRRGMSDHRVSGGRDRYEDWNVRAARQGIVDARGVGPSGGYRSRYVVESPGNAHAYPPMDGTTNPSLPAVRCDRMVILCGRCQHRNRRHGRQRPQHRRPRSDPDGPMSTRTRPARGALAPPHGLHQPGHPVSPRCGPRAPGCGGRASPGRRQPRSSDRRNAVTRRTAPAAAGHVGLTLQVRRHRADGRPHHSSPTVSTYRNGTSGMRAKTAHISFQPRGMSVRVARSIHIRTTASGWRKQISSSLLHDLEPTSAGMGPVTASVPSVRAPCGA